MLFTSPYLHNDVIVAAVSLCERRDAYELGPGAGVRGGENQRLARPVKFGLFSALSHYCGLADTQTDTES